MPRPTEEKRMKSRKLREDLKRLDKDSARILPECTSAQALMIIADVLIDILAILEGSNA